MGLLSQIVLTKACYKLHGMHCYSFPSILKFVLRVVRKDFRVTVHGDPSVFPYTSLQLQNYLFSFSALCFSFTFLSCLNSGKLNRKHLIVPFPWSACFLWHFPGCHPWISIRRKKIVTNWSTWVSQSLYVLLDITCSWFRPGIRNPRAIVWSDFFDFSVYSQNFMHGPLFVQAFEHGCC